MPGGESRYMEPLQLAGRLIMENGGETYRVEETITRMGRAFGLDHVESFAVPSGLFVSYRRADGDTETAVMRVHKGSTNLSRVDAVNAVSRQVEHGDLTCEEALQRLQAIERRPPALTKPMLVLGAAVSAAGFTLMFGGGAEHAALAAAVAALVQWISWLLERFRIHALVSTLLGSLLSTLLPMAFQRMTGLGMVDAIVAGALMPLLPGLAMTNAVQDAMRGDMISGLSHGLSAILTATLVAGGALMASAGMNLTGGAMP